MSLSLRMIWNVVRKYAVFCSNKSYKNISYSLRDWKFCWTSQAKLIVDLEIA